VKSLTNLVQRITRRAWIGGKAILPILALLAGAPHETYGQDANPEYSAKTNNPSLSAFGPSVNLGSGEPGLKIIYKASNQFVIFLDEPWTVGEGLIGGYYQRDIEVVAEQNYGLKEKLLSRTWHDFPKQLYAFDEQTAFTCDGGAGWSSDGKIWNYWPRTTKVFAISSNGISVSDDLYAGARARYGLTTNQLFLGRIGTNIYYWETQNPRRIYFRSVGGENASNYFPLPKAVIDIFGVTKGVTKMHKDLAFVVFRKSAGFFSLFTIRVQFRRGVI
jgi:hypothetical protein